MRIFLLFLVMVVLSVLVLDGAVAEAGMGGLARRGVPQKGYFAVLTPFAVFAILFLIVMAFGGNDYLSERLQGILTTASVGIIISAVFLLLYEYTKNRIFIRILIALIGILIIYKIGDMVYDKVKLEYTKKYGRSSSEDAWICRNCGAENHVIAAECVKCGSKQEG